MAYGSGLSEEDLLDWTIHEHLGAQPGWGFVQEQSMAELDIWLGMAFDLFGLPDGTHSPRGVSMRPGPDTLLGGLRQATAPLLRPSEGRLLDIRLALARLPTVDGVHVEDLRSGSQVIVLSAGVFAGLYSANDSFLELATAVIDQRPQKEARALAEAFPGRLSRFLFGAKDEEDGWMFTFRSRADPAVQGVVWADTTVQQMFLLLHELGHAADRTRSCKTEPIADGIVKHSALGTTAAEDYADTWAAEHMVGPMPSLIQDDRSFLVSGVFQFFEYLELLRKSRVYTLTSGYRMPRDRFERIADVFGPELRDSLGRGLSEHRAFLDDIGRFCCG